MSNDKLRVLVLKAESTDFEEVQDFEHSLDSMQAVVGGYIEAISLNEDEDGRCITVWLNEEGKLIGLEPNFALVDRESSDVLDIDVGDVLITSTDEEGNTVGLTDKEVEYVKSAFDFSRGVRTSTKLVGRLLLLN